MIVKINGGRDLKGGARDWELRRPAEDKEGKPAMKPQGRHCHTPGRALEKVWEAGLRADPGEHTLVEAVKKADRMRKGLLEVQR